MIYLARQMPKMDVFSPVSSYDPYCDSADVSDIGVLAAMLQARYVRFALARRGELQVACTGIFAAILSFFLLVVLPMPFVRDSYYLSTFTLYAAASGFAFVSATVVTGLTAAAAGCCDEEGEAADERLKRGRALGGFRSKVRYAWLSELTTGTTGTRNRTDPRLFGVLDVGTDDLLLFHCCSPFLCFPEPSVTPIPRSSEEDETGKEFMSVMHSHKQSC